MELSSGNGQAEIHFTIALTASDFRPQISTGFRRAAGCGITLTLPYRKFLASYPRIPAFCLLHVYAEAADREILPFHTGPYVCEIS